VFLQIYFPDMIDNYISETMFRYASAWNRLEACNRHYQTYPNIDIHTKDEETFKSCCMYDNLDLAKWMWNKFVNIDVRINSDIIFINCCEDNQFHVVQWLCTIEPSYEIITDNLNILRWRIRDNVLIQLDILDTDYNKVLSNLSIDTQIMSSPTTDNCLICLEPHDAIIRLPCQHHYCLESLIRFYECTQTKEVCIYCSRAYKFKNCVCLQSNHFDVMNN